MDMEKWEYFQDLLEGDQSDAEVQYALGCCYLRGKGVEQNGQEADKWLRRATAQGHQEAQALLDSVREAEEKSRTVTAESLPDWCMQAEGGDAEAQYQVALYFDREAVPGSRDDIWRYLRMAAEQGHGMACLELGRRLLATSPEEALAHLRNAADCGIPQAAQELGLCYARGVLVKKDLQEAERWFVQAASGMDGEAMLKLAIRYLRGSCVPKSRGRALSWVQRARLAGVADAGERFHAAEEALKRDLENYRITQQGLRYNEEKNYAQAVDCFREALDLGSPRAAALLGYCYDLGRGVERDPSQAFALYSQAAQQHDDFGEWGVGSCYERGAGVEKDGEQAVFWYRKAAQKGSKAAQMALVRCRQQGIGGVTKKEAGYWSGKLQAPQP